MLDKLDKEFAFGREALDVRAYRQELLSSNIANADTPGYKARDVDFASSLAGALKKAGGCDARAPRRRTRRRSRWRSPSACRAACRWPRLAPGHMAGTSTLNATGGSTDDYGRLAYRMPNQPSLDGNTVDLDSERVQFADNALHFEAGMTVLSAQIKSMLSAITSNT